MQKVQSSARNCIGSSLEQGHVAMSDDPHSDQWGKKTGLSCITMQVLTGYSSVVCMCAHVNKRPSSEDRVYTTGLFSIQSMLIICVEKSS